MPEPRDPGPNVIRSGRRLRALCVDDEPSILRLVGRLLDQIGIQAILASNPSEALELFADNRFDLVLTDVRMPGMDGLAFLHAIREGDLETPVVVVTGQATLDTAIKALREGASGMLVKPFTGEEILAEVRSVLDKARIQHDALQYRYVSPILDGVALALTAAIEARDLETGDHCRKLGQLGERTAQVLGLPTEEQTAIRIGGYLHDVGKIAIADRILLKPGALTVDEYREIQRHAALGAEIVQAHEALGAIAQIVRHHHERFDGRGYPDRLTGSGIPIGARIIAVCDAFDAMTTDRVYRSAIAVDAAWAEIRRHAGGQFDPQVVEAFATALPMPGCGPSSSVAETAGTTSPKTCTAAAPRSPWSSAARQPSWTSRPAS